MFVDPDGELRVTSGEPPDDADRRRTGPPSPPSEESEVAFLDDENVPADSPESDADDDDVSRQS